nr:DPP IV N-terminal domain-containing protein [Sphingomonas sp. Y57]
MAVDDIAGWSRRYDLASAVLHAAEHVANAAVYPHWLSNDRFWYQRRGEDDVEYVLLDAADGHCRRLFSQGELRAALTPHLGRSPDPAIFLPVHLALDHDAETAIFDASGGTWRFDIATGRISPAATRVQAQGVLSPDGKHLAFVRGHDLWVRALDDGSERPLTCDGQADHAYARLPMAMRVLKEAAGPLPPECRWSPDSRRLLSFRVDDRGLTELPIIEYCPEGGGPPHVEFIKTSLPGDRAVPGFEMIAFEVETGRRIDADYPKLPAVRMLDTPASANCLWWNSDGRRAYFVHVERGEATAHVVEMDVASGACRVLFTERSDSYVELGVTVYAPALAQHLPSTDELIWYSERSGRGHLYLYDLTDGALKHAITAGAWQVRDILHVDADRRELLVRAGGLDPADPYLCKPCRVSIDSGEMTIIGPEPGDHIIWRPGEYDLAAVDLLGIDSGAVSGVSPGGDYLVETIGAATGWPVTVLRSREGAVIALLEEGDDRGLPAGWRWPTPVRMLAADGATEVHGLLFAPWDVDPGKAVPLIDLVYGGPHIAFTPKSAFTGGVASNLGFVEAMHLSALGAYVLILDGRGTANRERDFRAASHGAVETASNLADHVQVIRELAREHPGIDLDRVGICGFSAGGYLAALAALRHDDLYKVAVAGGGNYDQRLMWHCWSERYHGLFDEPRYERQAAKHYADGLNAKLLLIHGLMDAGVNPAQLFPFVQALIDADKDFDMLLLPKAGHEMPGYALRRRLDYFVEHLFGSSPPPATRFESTMGRQAARLAATSRAAISEIQP